TAEPSPTATCSATGMPSDADLTGLPAAVAETAQELLDATVACDASALVDIAIDDATTLTLGSASPEEVLAVPDDDERYASMAQLLAGFEPGTTDLEGSLLYVWPRVATGEAQGEDAAWQELVDGGLLPAEEVEQMRAAGSYLWWRIGIDADGAWTFHVAGD